MVDQGRILNASFTDYLLPTALDMPPVEAVLVEEPSPWGPFGAKGMAELPTVGAAPAVAAAIRCGGDTDTVAAITGSIVGASVAILQDGRVRARHDVGWADRALGQRTDTNTIYHWATSRGLWPACVKGQPDRIRLALPLVIDERLDQLLAGGGNLRNGCPPTSRHRHTDPAPADSITRIPRRAENVIKTPPAGTVWRREE